MTIVKPSETLIHKTTHLMQDGMNARAFGEYRIPEALGDARWTDELILSTWYMAETGEVPDDMNFKTGKSDGGFDRLDFQFLPEGTRLAKACQAKLEDAELKIQKLQPNADGEDELVDDNSIEF